jgi:hypothetical protein
MVSYGAILEFEIIGNSRGPRHEKNQQRWKLKFFPFELDANSKLVCFRKTEEQIYSLKALCWTFQHHFAVWLRREK